MSWTNVHPEVTNIPQTDPAQCWLACLQMLYVWKGRSAAEPLEKLNADPNIFPDAWLSGGVSPDNCLQIGRALGLGVGGGGDVDIAYLAAALKQKGPYWVAGEFIKGRAHVKVVVGADPERNQIKFINPWNPIDPVDFCTIEKFNGRGERWKVFGTLLYWN